MFDAYQLSELGTLSLTIIILYLQQSDYGGHLTIRTLGKGSYTRAFF